MKTKLEMAHDYLIKLIEVAPGESTRSGLVSTAWNYADLMQAEADKRLAEAEYKEEWQPDWNQAPMCDVVAWDINEYGQARWIASDNGYYLAPSFDYQGDWRNSLRKRPN